MLNATLRYICATIVAVKEQYVSHIMSISVALGIQSAIHMHLFVICGLSGSTVFFHIIINGTIFEGKNY